MLIYSTGQLVVETKCVVTYAFLYSIVERNAFVS